MLSLSFRSKTLQRLMQVKLTDLLLLSALTLLPVACSTIPTETAHGIASREPVLLRHDASFGRVSSGSGKVIWEASGEVLLTPTTLYFIGGRGMTLSYAQMTSVAVQTVVSTTLLPGGRALTDQLVVRILRPSCEDGCVFNLRDAQVSVQAADLINQQRPGVDAFGHLQAGREVWISLGSRNAPYWWSMTPEYLLHTAPAEKKALDRKFCELLDCNGSGRSGGLYAAALETELAEGARTEYRFRNLHGVMVNRRTELDTRSLSLALGRVDPAIDSLLVSDLRSVVLQERVSADYRVSIEVTFRAFVDYFNIHPLIDGMYFWKSWSVTRPIEEWLEMSQAEFLQEIAGIARQVALQIQADLTTAESNEQGAENE